MRQTTPYTKKITIIIYKMIKKKCNQIITSKNEMTEGLFGMVILFIVEILPILEKKKTDISMLHWDIRTKSYGAIFPNIIEHKATGKLKWFSRKKRTKFKYLRSLQPQYVIGDNFQKLNHLFFKYFTITKDLDSTAASFELKDTLGIHFRGTDKTVDSVMNTGISKNDFYVIFDSFIKKHPFNRVFLATDENDVYSFLRSKYPHIEIISNRKFDDQNIFWRDNPDPTKNAKEAMIDMLCLSKCKTVLKVSSALSAFAKLINPELTIYRLNALKMFVDIPYFPDAYIPLLNKDEAFSENCNSTLEKVQKNDWSLTHKEKFNNFYIKER